MRPASRAPILVGLAAVVALTSTACGGTPTPADSASIAEKAALLDIDPALVFTTQVEGYDLAPQSVGPANDDGLSATWVDEQTAAIITIRTSPGEPDAAGCATTPLWDLPDTAVTCTEESGLWHREGGDAHEYFATRDGTTIWVIGLNGTPADDVRAAAEAVRVPSESELEALFSDAPTEAREPVERGDLPENGDGAPIDPSGPGG
ncbi:hypothetical protein [Microbacterium sp. VKM Ac-2923]|uniref:hypothetical protein n=1 Tax=Microbacterium sp. VKM Ac-2923 TaxID=2929476 RepID=UPI001FB50E1C|nr:hypothetical protein [Microbacterium sp. VKM Ac-2923]MCJ1706247.1 hypothetical protein [Microbacterium sp. VKM Ac-2923]